MMPIPVSPPPAQVQVCGPQVPRLKGRVAIAAAFSFFNGRLTLLRGQSPVNGLGVVAPGWLDPTLGSSNANAATRLYSMVGFGF
ncbi:hypothetical protein [Holophaga foetida]|uniref:hypothetical protein n=1 Tax=Holophaga foetida TaxID=35839 RepID=UPI0002471C87|nr:hypothetical protein [Holophaga foetida]